VHQSHSPTDLHLEPGQIPAGDAKAAERLGAAMLPRTMVTGISVKDGTVDKVVTDKGEIRCTVIVAAAGASV
jgi:glycine/D-amino acid oxidase-like deaminating enzyme